MISSGRSIKVILELDEEGESVYLEKEQNYTMIIEGIPTTETGG
jgi:hypothetical protein